MVSVVPSYLSSSWSAVYPDITGVSKAAGKAAGDIPVPLLLLFNRKAAAVQVQDLPGEVFSFNCRYNTLCVH